MKPSVLRKGWVKNSQIPSGLRASLVVHMVKNLPAVQRPGFDTWRGKIPWRRKQLPTPVFLPGELHGQRRLAGYSPWGCKRVGYD